METPDVVEVNQPSREVRIAIFAQVGIGFLTLLNWLIWTTWGVLPNSLVISGVFFFPPLALSVFSVPLLRKKSVYGWMAALVANGLMTVIELFTTGWLCILPAACLAYLLLPKVRDEFVASY